jgi:hypothetical protein
MISEKQLDANRSNAQLSTGARTEEGKRRCALNATRHGLTGQVSAMTEEDRAAHDAFSAEMLKDLAPDGALETQLAQRIATDSWRLNRICAIEDNLFAIGLSEDGGTVDAIVAIDHPQIHAAFAAAKTFEKQAKNLQLLSLYEQRLNRAVQKNLATLRQLQATRKAERRAALEEAKKLCQLDDLKGRRNDGGRTASASISSVAYEVNGFVFSTNEIRAAVDRDRRLQHAEHINFRHQKRHAERTLAA